MLRDDATGLPASRALHTPRLRFEPLAAAHARALIVGLRSDAAYELMGDRPPESVEALARRFRRLATRTSSDGRESWLSWALWSVPAGRYVGLVQATLHANQSAHITFVLSDEAWDNACAREAAATLIDHLYSERGLREVWTTVNARHRRAIALLEELGFLRIAERTDAEVIRGALSNAFVYCLSFAWPPFTFLT